MFVKVQETRGRIVSLLMWEFVLNNSTLLYFLSLSFSLAFIEATSLSLLKGNTSHRWERPTLFL